MTKKDNHDREGQAAMDLEEIRPERVTMMKGLVVSPIFKRRKDLAQKVGLAGAIIMEAMWAHGVRPGKYVKVDWEALKEEAAATFGQLDTAGAFRRILEGGWVSQAGGRWTMDLAADSVKKEGQS